ncbi:DUF87 domain-containing protein [Frankia sp. AiPs1]|uniref:helicase HerA domain-containing protein n=1 Tax=Frankia sp. AiPs1 TaxID=573493 RepID=UPI0020445DB3|nr:DUF87 domain-containing protein [Frankia sp. AiPs1]MCM3921174.1 DUF87 domain-containing protein [Frankia sp. AiPs1]
MITELDALAAIRLDWVHSLEDVWRSSSVHVDGLHTEPRRRILAALTEADTRKPLGVVVQGQAGAGKTHLLGWVRQQVQELGGYFFLVGHASSEAFHASVVGSMLSDLFRPVDGETQLRRFLRSLCELLRVPAELTASVVGETALAPGHLKDLIVALGDHDRALARECQHTLRALALYNSDDYDEQTIGETYLRSMDEQEPGERARRGIRPATRRPADIVHELSRLLALTGPSVIAVDQVDTVVAEAAVRDDDPDGRRGGSVAFNVLADGLLMLHERTERTLCLLACLPTSWILFRENAVTSVRDRFHEIMPLNRLEDPAITVRIIERRFREDFDRIGFTPPYPTWPVKPAALDRAPHFTPRELLQRIDRHLETCLSTGVVRELDDFAAQPDAHAAARSAEPVGPGASATAAGAVGAGSAGAGAVGAGIAGSAGEVPGQAEARPAAAAQAGERRVGSTPAADDDPTGPASTPGTPTHTAEPFLAALDAVFAELVATVPSVTPANEDIVMPELLTAGLTAWITENGGTRRGFGLEPSPSTRPPLHARLSHTLNTETGEQAQWSFRAITSGHGRAILPRITSACVMSGIAAGNPRRRLFLLRNADWGHGTKTHEALAAFIEAGGVVHRLDRDDLATFAALRTLFDRQHPHLREWLTARRPASGTSLLRTALGAAAVEPPGGGAAEPEVGAARTTDGSPDQIADIPTPAEDQSVARRADRPDTPDTPGTPGTPSAFVLGTSLVSAEPARLDLAVLRRHVAIFAGSGSGKTVLIRRLVEEAALRGVSSIVLDPNNDLARLGEAWPSPPAGWKDEDKRLADEYLADTDVVIWTPRRDGGRPVSFQPLPDFAGLRDDPDEFAAAVDAAVATLAARAGVTGATPRASIGRAILTAALRRFARGNRSGLTAFVELLADLPDGVTDLDPADKLAKGLAQTLRAAMVNDPLFGGQGAPVDPGELLRPAPGRRARVSVISLIGLPQDEQRQSFVNQLQLALFAWVKRNPAGARPLGGLFVMDEAQTFAPSGPTTACTASTLALAAQARKYGLGLVFATQAPKNLHNGIPGNATTQLFGRLNSPTQIDAARLMARASGGDAADIGRLGVGEFYATSEALTFEKIRTPLCLTHHPASPLTDEEVIDRAKGD